jgi:inositol phosphorylceramide mannosyltransferase catalytic subunit
MGGFPAIIMGSLPSMPSRVVMGPYRPRHPTLYTALLLLVLLTLWLSRHLLATAWTLAALPVIWTQGAESFVLSQRHDGFDVSFGNYSVDQAHAGPGFVDRVPPVLHHISLGAGAAEHDAKWRDVRQSCLDVHPGWEAHLWTDENADVFVRERFPDLWPMWMRYRFPIQRIDALRYMVLYEYGGQFDFSCLQS